jgi:hypothetical protein
MLVRRKFFATTEPGAQHAANGTADGPTHQDFYDPAVVQQSLL